MEAVNFLELIQWHLKEYGDISKARLLQYTRFYSQPFSLQLIEKYFAGWRKINFTRYEYQEKSLIVDLRFGQEHVVIQVEKLLSINSEILKLPKTLNNFITILLNENIPLTFNKIAINELNL